MTKDEKKFIGNLLTLFGLMEEAVRTLEETYNLCCETVQNQKFRIGEMDFRTQNDFEALSSRFSRVSDILVKQVFRLIDVIELQEEGTPIDVLNRAEKRELIKSANIFKEIRAIRNKISHEYIKEELEELYREILNLTPILLEAYRNTERYVIELKGKL